MKTPRFFIAGPIIAGSNMPLPASLVHHACRVLRLPEAAPIVLFDGNGGEYDALLERQGKSAHARVLAHHDIEREAGGRLMLLQGLTGSDKMDWIIEKAVELGVGELMPVTAERSIRRLDGERLARRMQRWQAIVEAASAQCGRNRLMQLHGPASLQECLDYLQGHEIPGLICHPGNLPAQPVSTLPEALQNIDDRLCLMIGPEAGWSDSEVALAQQYRARPLRFGSRVLRTETAGLALTAASMALLGW